MNETKLFKMKKITLILTISISVLNVKAQIKLPGGNLGNTINNAANSVAGSGANLSETDIAKGLKEALDVGTKNAVGSVSKTDGFFKNPKVKIPFPPEVKKVESSVRKIGMNKQADDFVIALNRAAEDAAKSATPIFADAIKSMTLTDAKSILKGNETAATEFMKGKTSNELAAKFKPIVQQSMQKVQVTKYWKPIATKYNQLPMTQKVNPDLEKYVTDKAIEGLFKIIADEEIKIRKDPAARINDILKSVFGS
jgi:putative sterol carrier protein